MHVFYVPVTYLLVACLAAGLRRHVPPTIIYLIWLLIPKAIILIYCGLTIVLIVVEVLFCFDVLDAVGHVSSLVDLVALAVACLSVILLFMTGRREDYAQIVETLRFRSAIGTVLFACLAYLVVSIVAEEVSDHGMSALFGGSCERQRIDY